MDRHHLAWLMVDKPKKIVRGRPMTTAEEAMYVREVAEAKTAALRMSLDAVERQAMPFADETGGFAPGQGMGAVPAAGAASTGTAAGQAARGGDAPSGRATSAASNPTAGRALGLPPEADDLAERVRFAREAAARHEDGHRPRAPRPEKMQR